MAHQQTLGCYATLSDATRHYPSTQGLLMLEIEDVLHVYDLHECFLGKYRKLEHELGPGGTHRVCMLAHNKLLVPLELVVPEMLSKEPSILELAVPMVPVYRQKKDKIDNKEYYWGIMREEKGKEVIRNWLTVVDSEGVEEIEEMECVSDLDRDNIDKIVDEGTDIEEVDEVVEVGTQEEV
jgi:hypothetical protein